MLVLTHVGSAAVLVLAGFTVIRATLGGVGRAPAFEFASAILVIAVGVWLFVRSVRHDHRHLAQNAGFVAFATGLVPCPLTTFVMVYSVANGIVMAGLLVTAAMAIGMIATICIFVGCTMLLRERALQFFERTAPAREHVGRALEIMSALIGRMGHGHRGSRSWTQHGARTIAFTAAGLPTTIMGIAMITNTIMTTDTASSIGRSPVRLAGSGP